MTGGQLSKMKVCNGVNRRPAGQRYRTVAAKFKTGSISRKQSLAESVVGSGEEWLTELDTDQLHNLLALRYDAIEDEAAEDSTDESIEDRAGERR